MSNETKAISVQELFQQKFMNNIPDTVIEAWNNTISAYAVKDNDTLVSKFSKRILYTNIVKTTLNCPEMSGCAHLGWLDLEHLFIEQGWTVMKSDSHYHFTAPLPIPHLPTKVQALPD